MNKIIVFYHTETEKKHEDEEDIRIYYQKDRGYSFS